MAMPLAPLPYWTVDQVRALPEDGNRYEVVHGELLVSPAPSPRHQRVLANLFLALGIWLKEHRVGMVFTAPADLGHGPDSLLQPDLFVLGPAAASAEAWAGLGELLLAVEILSPSTARQDRFQKRRAYQEAGVPLYWIVDIEQRRVESWTPDASLPAIETERLTWRPAGAAEPCTIPVAELFA